MKKADKLEALNKYNRLINSLVDIESILDEDCTYCDEFRLGLDDGDECGECPLGFGITCHEETFCGHADHPFDKIYERRKTMLENAEKIRDAIQEDIDNKHKKRKCPTCGK